CGITCSGAYVARTRGLDRRCCDPGSGCRQSLSATQPDGAVTTAGNAAPDRDASRGDSIRILAVTRRTESRLHIAIQTVAAAAGLGEGGVTAGNGRRFYDNVLVAGQSRDRLRYERPP